jgi:hypothetical protein
MPNTNFNRISVLTVKQIYYILSEIKQKFCLTISHVGKNKTRTNWIYSEKLRNNVVIRAGQFLKGYFGEKKFKNVSEYRLSFSSFNVEHKFIYF